MTTAPTSSRQRRVGRTFLVVAAVILVIGALVAAATWVLGGFPPSQPTLRDTLAGSSQLLSPEEDTGSLCAEMDCIEAWRTDVGVFIRFRTNDMAEYWQYVIGGDSIKYENTVLDMNGLDLTRDERRLAIDTLFSRRDWRVI